MLQNELSITHRNFASFHHCLVKDKTVSFWSVDNDQLYTFRWVLNLLVFQLICISLVQLCSYNHFMLNTSIHWIQSQKYLYFIKVFKKQIKHKHLHLHPPLIETWYIIYVNQVCTLSLFCTHFWHDLTVWVKPANDNQQSYITSLYYFMWVER